MIYIDGASLTYGHDLSNPETEAWPACLSRKFNTTVVNNAQNGKSNDHMIFDTINFCLDTKPELVIVAFGPVSRKFFVRRENNHILDLAISSSNFPNKQSKELQEFQHLLFKYWSNYLYDSWRFLQSIIYLQSFFKSYNIPYLLMNTVNQQSLLDLISISTKSIEIKNQLLDAFSEMNNDQILNVEKQLQNLYKNIDHTNFYNFDWHFKKLVEFNNHPNAEQHQIIADFLSTIIESKQI